MSDPNEEVDEILQRIQTDEMAEAGKTHIKLGFSAAAFLMGAKVQNITEEEALKLAIAFSYGLGQSDRNGPIV